MSKEAEIKAGNEEKGVQNVPPTTKPSAPQAPKNNTVPVDREQLAQILRDNEEFRTQIAQLQSNAVSTQPGSPLMVRNKKKETLIKLRRWNDEIVVGWVNKATRPGKFTYVYSETDEKTRETKQFIDVILQGKENKPLKLEYLQYLQESDPVFVKMLEKIVGEEEIIDQGRVFKKDFVENGYGMFETTVQVPVEVVIPHASFRVQLEDGEELTISDRFVG